MTQLLIQNSSPVISSNTMERIHRNTRMLGQIYEMLSEEKLREAQDLSNTINKLSMDLDQIYDKKSEQYQEIQHQMSIKQQLLDNIYYKCQEMYML